MLASPLVLPITAMTKGTCHFPALCLLLLLLTFASGRSIKPGNGQDQVTWCVPRPSSDDIVLKENIHYACGVVDCTVIQEGSPCHEPSFTINHASVVMNRHYQKHQRQPHTCSFNGTGLLTITDPSYGNCKYDQA